MVENVVSWKWRMGDGVKWGEGGENGGEWGHISLLFPLPWWAEGSRDPGQAASLGHYGSVWTALRQLEQGRKTASLPGSCPAHGISWQKANNEM